MNKEIPHKRERFLADGKDLVTRSLNISKNGTPEQKKASAEALRNRAREEGVYCLHKSLKDGLMTDDEWSSWQNEYNLDLVDLGTILPAYFGWKAKEVSEKPLIITTPKSNIMKAKDLIKAKFDLEVMDVVEFMAKEKARKNKAVKADTSYIG